MKQVKKLSAACVCLLILVVPGIPPVNAQGERETAVRKAPLDTQRDYSIGRRAMDPQSDAVSKYIGETEKNLSHTLDRAATEDWLLHYDEADELFEKRTDMADDE